jgi:hypothetical protein
MAHGRASGLAGNANKMTDDAARGTIKNGIRQSPPKTVAVIAPVVAMPMNAPNAADNQPASVAPGKGAGIQSRQ